MTGASDVAIVGAGPYALSTAAFLREAGAEVRVFGKVMGFWETMPEGMFLRSFRTASSIADPAKGLSLEAYERATGKTIPSPLPLDDFIAYGRWYQEQTVPDVDPRLVTHVRRDDEEFQLTLGDGESVRARRVVIAAGIAPFAWRPPEFAGLGPDRASHSSEHRVFDRFSGQRVVVIGGGQSALESAALLHEAGASVEVLVRGQSVHFLRGERVYENAGLLRDLLYPPLGVGPPGLNLFMGMPRVYRLLPRMVGAPLAYRTIRPAGAAWLRPRLADVEIDLGRSVTSASASNGGVRLTLGDGSERAADHLLLGTGYRVDIRSYDFLDPGLAAAVRTTNGYPVLSRFFESSVDRLYFLGAVAAVSAGPGMRFVSHTRPVAVAVTKSVVAATDGGRRVRGA
jgi:NADPH-dependent 2,4-dienoyl-CoA reductase/sulfur reductase-like enzyme